MEKVNNVLLTWPFFVVAVVAVVVVDVIINKYALFHKI